MKKVESFSDARSEGLESDGFVQRIEDGTMSSQMSIKHVQTFDDEENGSQASP